MKVKTFQFNPVGENTYIVFDETKECVIIDAGCFFPNEKELLLSFIQENNLVVKRLLNTHLHFDHVLGNQFIKEQFGLDCEANKADEFLLDGLEAQLRMFGFPPVGETPKIGKYINEGDIIEFGNQKFEVFEVPGHSPGSVVFYSKERHTLFVGDVLFRYSIGRTDLAGGSYEQLIEGIHNKLLILPPETLVYSGHGPTTTIGEEIKNNPYL